ncbi:MAG: hypothetical protein ACRC8W_00625 [Plesiomonas shigelloides]
MALELNVMTRGIDFEEKGKLLNVAELSLTNAATSNVHPIRKGEFDTTVAALEAAIADAAGASHSYVDTTNLTLADALADGTFADGAWTFGATSLHVGDVLFLDAATEQDSDRAWLMIVANGDVGDFKAFGTDVDAAITAAVNTVKGNATVYTNLGLVEDKLDALDGDITALDGRLDAMEAAEGSHTKTVEYAVTWGAPDVDGIRTATIDTSADFGTYKVNARVLKVKAGGFFEHLSSTALVIESSNTSVRLRTDSSSIAAATLKLLVSGTPAVV